MKEYAKGVKSYGKEIWLRPFHEANGDWYDWGIAKQGAGNTNQTLIDAWKHVVTIFRDLEVTNVKWVWTTNATNSGSATFTGWFPGDDWVDMVSIDGYNWGTTQSWSSWTSFADVFDEAYKALSISQSLCLLQNFPQLSMVATRHNGLLTCSMLYQKSFPGYLRLCGSVSLKVQKQTGHLTQVRQL